MNELIKINKNKIKCKINNAENNLLFFCFFFNFIIIGYELIKINLIRISIVKNYLYFHNFMGAFRKL